MASVTDLLLPGHVADPSEGAALPMIIADDLHVSYQVYASGKKMSARESMMSLRALKGGRDLQTVPALRGVSFTASEGESIGVVGHNGSGKSTLFRTMSGLIPPSEGAIYARDRPVLLGVNAALVPELSGENNIRLGLLAMGFTPDEAAAQVDEIADFAELNDFIYHPMKTYSSGMAARLRFAIASAKAHSILLIDEALAVGDRRFRAKSEKRINELRDSAGLVMIVSHSVGSLKETCERVLWVHKGELIADGPTDDVIDEYVAWTKNPSANAVGAASAPKPETKNAPIAVGFEADAGAQESAPKTRASAVVAAEPGSRALARRERHRQVAQRKRQRSVLLLVLSGVAILLAVAAGAIIGTLASVASPTDPSTPESPQPSQSATTAAAAPEIKSFTVNAPTVECASEEAEAQVLLSWQISNAKSVALASGETQVDALDFPDASALPKKMTDRAVPFACSAETVVYTLTAENADGVRVSSPLTVGRVLPVETEEPEAPRPRRTTPQPQPTTPPTTLTPTNPPETTVDATADSSGGGSDSTADGGADAGAGGADSSATGDATAGASGDATAGGGADATASAGADSTGAGAGTNASGLADVTGLTDASGSAAG